MKLFFTLFATAVLMLSFSITSEAQIVLNFERVNKAKAQKYFIGDEITYRKFGEKEFQTATIIKLIEKEEIIVLDRQYINVADIEALRTYNNRGWSRRLGNQLYGLAGGWLLFTAGDELISPNYTADWEMAAYVSGSAILTGILIQTIFKRKTHKLDKWKRLRVLNLNPGN